MLRFWDSLHDICSTFNSWIFLVVLKEVVISWMATTARWTVNWPRPITYHTPTVVTTNTLIKATSSWIHQQTVSKDYFKAFHYSWLKYERVFVHFATEIWKDFKEKKVHISSLQLFLWLILRCHVIGTCTREADLLLARMFVRVVSHAFWIAFSQCFAKTLLSLCISHALSISLN